MTEENEKRYDMFDEYLRQGEPSKREAAFAWSTAIGLQDVDRLKTSDYLREVATRNIEGEITMDEAHRLIHSYYKTKTNRTADTEATEEADKAAANISRILSSDTLDFSTNGYKALHRRIFTGVFKHAGQIRDYDITKRELVLNGDTVRYLNWEDLNRALDYDIAEERAFSYAGLSGDKTVEHISRFVSGLWQIHAFGEGNTRTTAVFTIQYLRSLGFVIDNDLFSKHAWYFRNALVRANYKNAAQGIDYTFTYLERFFRNLLLGEQWVLKSRYLFVNPPAEYRDQPRLDISPQVTPQVPPQLTPTSTPTSTEQVTRTSTRTSSLISRLNPNSKFYTNDENTIELVRVIGDDELSIKELMSRRGLKQRPNFIEYHLNPALHSRFLRRKYPDNPNHPRQRYLLTVKGRMLYNELSKQE
ncbi:MAG: Fic family protein [Paludibacteraceae bacterium]|nr:Fic family protein [Paludibacteraceae bacterium]